MSRCWTPGTQVMWHQHPRGADPAEPTFCEPVTVVRDDGDGLVAWMPAGTTVLRKAREDGADLRSDKATMFTARYVQALATWTTFDVLRIAPRGRPWSVWACFRANEGPAGFAGWYVNLEDVHERDAHGTYTRDRVLDVEVEPDGSSSRKDEDELVLAVEQGRHSEAEAAAITASAGEVEAVVAAWGPPFCDGWESFIPDPAWPVAALPVAERRRAVLDLR